MRNKENSYKLKQEVFLDQCCLHLAKWSITVLLLSLCMPVLKYLEQANSYYNPLVRCESLRIDLNWAPQPLTQSKEMRKGAWVSVTAAVLHKHTIN